MSEFKDINFQETVSCTIPNNVSPVTWATFNFFCMLDTIFSIPVPDAASFICRLACFLGINKEGILKNKLLVAHFCFYISTLKVVSFGKVSSSKVSSKKFHRMNLPLPKTNDREADNMIFIKQLLSENY